MTTAEEIHQLQKMTPLARTHALHAKSESEIAALCQAIRMPARAFSLVSHRIIWLNDQISTRPLSDLIPATPKGYISDRARRTALITQGTVPEPLASEIVTAVAENLQSLSRGTPTIHAAPARGNIYDCLRNAAEVAKRFTNSAVA